MRLADDNPLRLALIERITVPFDYFISPQAFRPEVSRVVLEWLETSAPWKLVIADFYEQYEFSFWNVKLPDEVTLLIQPNFLNDLRGKVGSVFDTEFDTRVDVAAHKLVSGQRIRMHNDFISGQETHRLIIQLNRQWKESNGGLFMLFNSSDARDVHRVFLPVHNTAIGLALSPISNHAVSTVYAGERFTLAYSFYSKE
jgi:Rps23 Pro-64 3,4-dihydroxylase Tpa1-like proline 4-hydroxylase